MAVTERSRRTPVSALEFVGCLPVRVSRNEIEGPEWEGRRVEHWHAATGTAWIAREPASPYHERPSRRLSALVERICLARGSDAACFGGMDLRVRQEDGTLGDFMQADETVYLHPSRSKLPQGIALMVGEDAYPDVVLEVDNTTDVRRGKLVAYAEWGFPEVWVEVPDRASPGIEGPVSLTLIGGFVTLAAWPEVAWAVSALIAFGCIASLAGWLDRPQEWLVELTPTRAFD